MFNSTTERFGPDSDVASLVELVRWRAIHQTDQRAYTFLTHGDTEERHLTYGELDQKARAIAALLQQYGATGQRALLLYQPGLDYITGFFGCLYAGVIAVPTYPPDPARLDRTLPRLQMLIADSQSIVVLTTQALLAAAPMIFKLAPALSDLHWLATDALSAAGAANWHAPVLTPADLAFFQYTSGSTRTPRGVMLTHGNLLHNSALIAQVFQHSVHSIGVIWLPPYHDMGLIGGLLQPIYAGFPCVLMSPHTFLQRPLVWLQAISRYGATSSGGPNFAYDLCVRKVDPEQCASLDLSSWNVAFCGAEPVRHETLERFAATFAPYGFRKEAFYPCYGMAEATLMASAGDVQASPTVYTIQSADLAHNKVVATVPTAPDSHTFIGCGWAWSGQKLVIVNPETCRPCAPDQVGEIWLSGPSVAQGYWNRPAETEQTFRAYLADSGEGPFLRTGDLGFMQHGELFITGRLKDLIILNGQNIYPQDIELTVDQSHAAIRPGCSAAFSLDLAGEERLVVVAEVERTFLSAQRRQSKDGTATDQSAAVEAVTTAIRQAISEQHMIQVYAVVLLKTGYIPKTSSGKIQRHACQRGFLDGTLETVGQSLVDIPVAAVGVGQPAREQASSPMRDILLAMDPSGRHFFVEAYLRTQVARALRRDPTSLEAQQPLTAFGVDSLSVVEITSDIETQFGVEISVASLLRSDSLHQLADQVLTAIAGPSMTQLLSETLAGTSDAFPPSTHTPDGIAPVSEPQSPAALSYGQRALWFLQQLQPDSPAYMIANAVRIPTDVDIPALQRAFQRLVKRHAPLRAAFTTQADEPHQQFLPLRDPFFQVENATTWNEDQLRQRIGSEVYRPFDLEQDPLLRVFLFTRSADEQIMLLVIHHIVADLWSLAILVHEIERFYQAEKAGRSATLEPLNLQYSDYVEWQSDMLAGAEGARLWAYWQRQLAGDLPILNLPTDRPRPPLPSHRGATHTIRLGAELTQGLRSVAAAHGATLFTTVLAAFQVLLHRYSGQDDILVGSPWAGRRQQWAGLIGYFVNPLPLRANLAGDPTFSALLNQVRQTVLEAFDHADYPFALLVKQLQPERDAGQTPIFQVMFSWQKTSSLVSSANVTAFALNEAGGRLGSAELPLESVMVEDRVAPFDLTLFMGEAGDELAATLEYSTDLFDAQTIQRMLQHFHELLEGIIANPKQSVAKLPLLTRTERDKILVGWNDTAVAYPQNVCLHQLIAEQARRTPEAPAVVFEGQTLTYHDLNQRANQLAHYLLSLGVMPDTLIALCVERSFEMIVGLLGILKAGAAYLPLDPSYPADRLAFMLQDSRAPMLLTQQHIDHHGWTHSASQNSDQDASYHLSLICLDRDWATIAQQPSTNPDSPVTADHMAYVIYTSGSTGQPKGVVIEHRAIVNRLLWMQETYHLTASDRVLQKTPFTFDVSVWEFFWPLLTGACLVVARPEGHKDTPYLVDLIAQEQITTLHFVPPMLHVFLAEADTTRCHTLRRVICSGEALPFELQQRFYALLDAELHNLYGPTEAAVDVSFWACERLASRPIVPIGRPVANTQLYVLDAQMQPVPIGVAGELHIGGVQLARGYLNRPDLTAEKFIPDPFSQQPGARLYKTGDLARFLPDGAIEYLGRLDHQVKIRGFRIELGEIETHLGQHPAIREVVVLAREDTHSHKRLVAYLVPNQKPVPSVADIRQFLHERLPEYMVPSAFVTMDALPLTPNGKVNRRALPRPEEDRSGLDVVYLAPRTPVEATLADIWSQVLGVRQVGIYDNFFELGGDSIMSIQVVGRANRAGLRMSPQQVFQFPILSQLASVVANNPAIQSEQGLVEGDVPLTPVQHWFFAQHLPEPDHWNQAVLLEARQPLVRDLLEKTMHHLLWHHDALRMQFVREGESWRQFNTTHIDAEALVTWIDLAAMPVAQQDATVEATATRLQSSLNLANGPLVRVAYFDPGSARSGRLLFIIHHLVVDGVSWRILLEDFQTVYQQLSQDLPPQLPPKTSAFQQWAKRLATYAKTAAAHSELEYWLSLPLEQSTTLPIDHPGGANTEASASQVHMALNTDDTRVLLQQVTAVYGTGINDVLLTALVQALAARMGQHTLLLDLEGHGREDLFADIDLSRTAGWFTTIYPVVLALPETGDPGALLVAIKEQLHRIPQRGIGYGVLRYLGDADIADQMQRLASAEVRFNYLGQFDQNYAESVLFAASTAHPGLLHSPRGQRSYVLEIDAMIKDGMLQVEWTYSHAQYAKHTIEQIAETFMQALRQILADCTAQDTRIYTPSDFPLAEINQHQLDAISAKVQKALKRGAR